MSAPGGTWEVLGGFLGSPRALHISLLSTLCVRVPHGCSASSSKRSPKLIWRGKHNGFLTFSVSVIRPSCQPFGASWGSLWGPFGVSWGPLGGSLGSSWVLLPCPESLQACPGCSHSSQCESILEPLSPRWHFWWSLQCSWWHLGASWQLFGLYLSPSWGL